MKDEDEGNDDGRYEAPGERISLRMRMQGILQ